MLLVCASPSVMAAPAKAGNASKASATAYGKNPLAQEFAAEVADRRGMDPAWLRAALARAHRLPAVQKLIMPPPAGTAKNWAAYRARFIEPQRIQQGIDFWRQNEAWLQEADERWGVPAEVVVAIVGVETFYGRVTGNFRVVDALATLSFDFPTGRRDRSAFFREELEEFFVWCLREGVDPLTVKGSFAGAMGLPQFMPGSINRFAVDFDGDGHINLLRSPADAVGSVAHYLARHGWQRGLATTFEVVVPVDTTDRAALLAPDILPTFSAADFASRGAVLDAAGQAHDGRLALVELQNGERAPSYVAGTRNFWAITRYNWSSYYAMAVIDLAAELRRRR